MENLDKALNAIGISVASEIKKLAKKDGFDASGDLDNSITYKVEGNTVTVEGNKYIGAISGGINKKKFPNVDRIKKMGLKTEVFNQETRKEGLLRGQMLI